jgi:hypothetical protein
MSQGNQSTDQAKWTATHKQKNPQGEAIRKEKQRAREELMRIHIRRNHLYGYGIPPAIDQGSDAFKRVRDEYMSAVDAPVEVVGM